MSESPTSQPAPRNGRPQDVVHLLQEGEIHPTWASANKNKNRFYLLNIDIVIDNLAIDVTRMDKYFTDASNTIKQKTNWHQEGNFKFAASHVQINKSKRFLPKYFGSAATIIVALELIASKVKPSYNVYNWLRILQADFFVDRFNAERLQALEKHYKELKDSERTQIFGDEAKKENFEQIILTGIEQGYSSGLLRDLANGSCATRYTSNKLVDFINGRFPKSLEVGPVRLSGDPDRVIDILGERNTAATLRVPRRHDPAQLTPCLWMPEL